MRPNDEAPLLFGGDGQPTQRRPLPFSPFPPAARRRLARPTVISRIPRDTNIATAYKGAELQGLPLLRQGEEIAAVMEATTPAGLPLYPTVGVMLPRRATKTTSLWSVYLGRCYDRPGWKVVTTAQDGIRARQRFREVQRALEARDFEGRVNPSNRLGKLRWANGDESIEFDNGSRIWVVPPDPGAFRGEAADDMLFDESGELPPEKSADLVAGALPLMDTRPRGQVVIAGTPKIRAGLLWDTLQAGTAQTRDRSGRKTDAGGIGVVAYYLRDNEQFVTYNDQGEPQFDVKLLRRVHPGIGELPGTTPAKILGRFGAMGQVQFEAEYLCRFPFDNQTGAVDPAAWEDSRSEDALPARPDIVGLAFDVDPDGTSAALLAAWRDDDGRAHLEVLACRPGTQWIADMAGRAARKHRGVPIGYDPIGLNADVADQLRRAHVRIQGLPIREISGAAVRLVDNLNRRNLITYRQPDLDNAANGASWRNYGESRLFSRKTATGSVAPLVAASEALWIYDQVNQPATRTRVRTGRDTPRQGG